MTFDVAAIRAQFPITAQRFPVRGRTEPQPLVYFDHAASTHPPTPVLETLRDFLEHSYAHVHRGRHSLSQLSTEHYEHGAEEVLSFIGAERAENNVVLCGNTTQALDLAAHVLGEDARPTLVSLLEHHSNDLPHRRRGRVVHFGSTPEGHVDLDDLTRRLERERPKLVAVT